MNNCSLYNIVFWFVILSVTAGCKKNYDEMMSDSLVKRNYIPVFVQDLTSTSDAIPIYAIGRVSSDTETKLSFKTGGYISSMRAREGDYVRKGKLLATLRTEEIDAQVLKAERAQIKAQRDLERITNMYNDSVATLENVQDLTTLVDVRDADLRVAKYNQQYSRIASPISGRLLRRMAEPNELVSPGQPIFVIASSTGQSYIMKINVSDKDISMLAYGTKAFIAFDAFKGEIFHAKVNRLAESADPITGTFEVELSLDANNRRIRNGMIGKVTLEPFSSNQYVKIPMISIAEGNNNIIQVYTPDDSDTIAVLRNLEVVRFADDFVWVNGSTITDDRIITAGSAYLKDGQVIKIQNKEFAN